MKSGSSVPNESHIYIYNHEWCKEIGWILHEPHLLLPRTELSYLRL